MESPKASTPPGLARPAGAVATTAAKVTKATSAAATATGHLRIPRPPGIRSAEDIDFPISIVQQDYQKRH
jgi:hypothetical protein